MSGESIRRKTQGETIAINQSPMRAGTRQAHYSWQTLFPPDSSFPWSPVFLMPSSPPPPSAATSGYQRFESMACTLFSLLSHTNLLAQSSWVQKTQDRLHMAKRCFPPSFSSLSHHGLTCNYNSCSWLSCPHCFGLFSLLVSVNTLYSTWSKTFDLHVTECKLEHLV